MAIYGNNVFVNEEVIQERNIMNYNFDMYEYIKEEISNMKSMLLENVDCCDKVALEQQIDIITEKVNAAAFIKNIIVKIKELVKTILAKIQQISTQFGNKKYIDFWKNTKIDQETLTKQVYYAIKRYVNSDNDVVVIDFTFWNKDIKLKNIQDIMDKAESWDDLYYNLFKSSDESYFINKTEDYDEFKSKNSAVIKFIMSNKNKIIEILEGKEIYSVKKNIIKIESEMEQYLNNIGKKDEGYSDSKEMFKAVSEYMRGMSKLIFSDFRFYLALTSLCMRANANDPTDNEYYSKDNKASKKINKANKDYNKFSGNDKSKKEDDESKED